MQTVFESNNEYVYRIPALLYVRERKTLLAFAERRRDEDDSSAEMLVMKTGKLKEESTDVRTIKWKEFKPVKEARKDGHRTMNPCPVYDKRSGKLFLFFICVEGTVTELWQIRNYTNKARLCYITSKNCGQSWSKVKDLTDELDEIKNWATFAVGPGHGLQMKSGRLIVPVYAYVSCSQSCCCCIKCCCCMKCCCPPVYALALFSDDSGENWQLGKKLQVKSNECQMAEFFDDMGKSFIYCNARNRVGWRVEAVSDSKGNDFTVLCCCPKLPETGKGCQGSVVSFPAQGEGANTEGDASQNKWLLFTHPSNKSRRVDLGVYLNKSPQDPKAWSKPWIINGGPSGYSDLAYIDDGWFACVMESGEKKETEQIFSVVFSYEQVKQNCGQTLSSTSCLCC